ncbi:MAG: hypothetical protein OXH10_03865 [bacterium]|nr:hypothetical protein [bacterium]MCY3580026.1 hypothetical protein [bacterium]
MNLLNQMIRAGRIDRSFYRSLVFDNYATGNAVVVIALVGALPHIWAISLLGVGFAILAGLLRAALVTGAIWGVSVYIFKRYGNPRTTFRMVGFANVAFLPLVFTPLVTPWWVLALFITAVWLFLALRIVALSQFDLEHPENSFAAASGLLGWYLSIILF